MKLTRRGLLAALGVAPAAAKVEAGVREQPKTKAEPKSALWIPRGREMEVINSGAFETAFWGWPATGKTEAGLWFLALGHARFGTYANYPHYRGLVLLPSHMAVREWMQRAKETFGNWRRGASFSEVAADVRFGSGARIHVAAGVDDYLARLRGCAFQQIVFDSWVPERQASYFRILEMGQDFSGSMPPRVLVAARPPEVPRWAVKRFGKSDSVRESVNPHKIRTICAEDPVISISQKYTGYGIAYGKFRC